MQVVATKENFTSPSYLLKSAMSSIGHAIVTILKLFAMLIGLMVSGIGIAIVFIGMGICMLGGAKRPIKTEAKNE